MKNIICKMLFLLGAERLYKWVHLMKNGPAVRVLSLHRVIDEHGSLSEADHRDLERGCLALSDFKRRISYLSAQYSFFTISQCVENKDAVRNNAIVLTCDDGYRDVYTTIYPFMRDKGMPFTVFVTPGWVGCEGMLTRADIDIMSKDPLVEWGAHGVSHLPLTELSISDAEQEIVGSKKAVEELIGRPVSVFSYPDGKFNDEIKGLLIKQGFISACATGRTLNYGVMDLFVLKRIPFENEPIERFAFRMAGLV